MSPEHFPVYVKDSKYNTDDNWDYGTFTKLANKMTLAGVNLTSFMKSFNDLGVFAFADYATPTEVQTLVYVTEDVQAKCEGVKQWPLTIENLNKLDINPDKKKMRQYDNFLHSLPFLFFALAAVLMFAMGKIEARIEA